MYPVGAVCTLWAYARLREISVRGANQQIDYLGNMTFALGLTLVLVAVTYGLLLYHGQNMGWSDPWVVGLLAGSAPLPVPLPRDQVADPMFRLFFFRVRCSRREIRPPSSA